ncbi:MAG TPA: molybdate ABC transporter substrate-binding protein [Gammaproteobacteria bacterium]|nr:molybdate ABC transporter substrate-binding protein [Gammaproteobacteria bacterium]
MNGQLTGLAGNTARRWGGVLLALMALAAPPAASGGEVTVAVASNFIATLERLARDFQIRSGDRLRISSGSTGRLYAQIRHGAPYDVFLAADEKRPRLIEASSQGVAGSRFTYAIGRLVLWSPRRRVVDERGPLPVVRSLEYIAIANPRTAPYGEAAVSVLHRLGLWSSLRAKVVRGENVAQAYQYVATGNAGAGLVSLAQWRKGGGGGFHWLVPPTLHAPLRQQAVLLKRAQDNPAARAFMAYLESDAARDIIKQDGYELAAANTAGGALEQARTLATGSGR